jgi:hypothetical protein
MKKHISFLLLSVICVHVFSQDVTTSIKAGINFANVETKGDDNNQIRFAAYGGLSFNIPMTGQLYIQPEILYSMRGYRYKPDFLTEKGSYTFGYITAPLLLGYNVTKNFSILVGPEFGYMVSARARFGDDNSNFYEGIQRKFNVDVDAGMGWQISKSILLEARVNFGVTALYRGVLVDPQGNPFANVKDGYHRVLQFGISIPL